MKKILILSLAIFTLIACEEDRTIYSGDTFVSFRSTQSAVSINEAIGTYNLQIGIADEQNEDINVGLDVTSDTAIEGTHFNIPSSITIPAGETLVTIPVEIVDDELSNPIRNFTVEIVSVSNPSVNIGILDEGSYSKSFSIVNDDCPTQFTYWVGDIIVEDVGYGSFQASSSVNETGDCDLLIVDGNVAGFGNPDNTIYEIQFIPTNTEGTEGITIVESTLVKYQADTNSIADAYYEASGTFDTETGEIVLDYELPAFHTSTGEYLGSFGSGTTIITIP